MGTLRDAHHNRLFYLLQPFEPKHDYPHSDSRITNHERLIMTTDTTPDTTDWKAIALALAQRVNFAMTNLDSKGGGGMLNTETMQITPWRDYLAEAMEMIPGVTVDREILATLYLPQAKRRKAQAEIRARRAAKVLDSIAPATAA